MLLGLYGGSRHGELTVPEEAELEEGSDSRGG
jgi:hypothetical protein